MVETFWQDTPPNSKQPPQISQIWRKCNNLKSCVSYVSAALKQLHGIADCDSEQEDIEKERNSLSGLQAKKPWELFADRSLRWQVLTIMVLNAAQQLNGINAVRTTTLKSSHKDKKRSFQRTESYGFVFVSLFVFYTPCRFTSTQVTCSNSLVFPVIRYHTPLSALVPVNASPL